MAEQEPTSKTPKPIRDGKYWKQQERRNWVEMLLGLGFGRIRYSDTPKPGQDGGD